MASLSAQKVIRRVRQRMGVSQEGLSRLLNATKGAVQHWERGRNNPDLGRLLALRQLCPAGPERKELDALIRQTQAHIAPLTSIRPGGGQGELAGRRGRPASALDDREAARLRRENEHLRRDLSKLQAALDRRNEQLRILGDLATERRKERERPAPKPARSTLPSR
jgi:transcriptional regulator with XRE-family HTH domain